MPSVGFGEAEAFWNARRTVRARWSLRKASDER
jgi:hypothetical protein